MWDGQKYFKTPLKNIRNSLSWFLLYVILKTRCSLDVIRVGFGKVKVVWLSVCKFTTELDAGQTATDCGSGVCIPGSVIPPANVHCHPQKNLRDSIQTQDNTGYIKRVKELYYIIIIHY